MRRIADFVQQGPRVWYQAENGALTFNDGAVRESGCVPQLPVLSLVTYM